MKAVSTRPKAGKPSISFEFMSDKHGNYLVSYDIPESLAYKLNFQHFRKGGYWWTDMPNAAGCDEIIEEISKTHTIQEFPKPAKETSSNIFSKAKSLKVPQKVVKNAKSTKKEFDFGAELDVYSAINALVNDLEAKRDQIYRVKIDNKAWDIFVDEALALKDRPENFRGIAECSSASLELRKRSSSSALTEEEVEIFGRYDIVPDSKIISEGKPGLFAFNPDIEFSPELSSKISNALSKIPELKGMLDDLIVRQEEQPETVVQIVPEDVISQVAKKVPKKELKQVLKIAATLAVKPKFGNEEYPADLETVFEILKANKIKLEG